MLWAQFQPRNDAEAVGFVVGVAIAGLVSGGIPFFTGLAMKQSALAIIGGIVSAGAGALAGCCAGLPVAIVFTIVIVVVAQSSRAIRERSHSPDRNGYDYDEYGRAFRLATRDSVPEPDAREQEADDDWRRRAEDERRYRKRGFRPRPRDNDQDD